MTVRATPTPHALPTPPASPAPDRAEALLWPGLVLTLTPLLTRACSNLDLLPGWDIDPFTSPLIRSGLTPAGSMICDAVSLLGAALLMLFVRLRALPISLPTLALAAIGAIGVLLRAFVLGPPAAHGSIANARIGLAWISAIAAAVALFHASRDPRARSVAIATLLGFFTLLAFRALHERFIDHPRTIADYLADKAQILASHGWTPESSMARAFERRLLQSDVSGWFGLSNVFGAILAVAAVIFIGLALSARAGANSDAPAPFLPRALILLGAALSLTGVGLSQSKGATIALAAGLLSLPILYFLRRRHARSPSRHWPTLAGLLGLAAVIGPLGLIAGRAAIGERIAELSIYFRWFYIEAAARIFAARPFSGVGPDGFQAAYTLAKNPISPEEVTSPHSILFDWLATLGLFGIAWIALLIFWSWRAGRAPVTCSDPMTDPAPHSRNQTRAALAIAALTTVAASAVQGSVVTPDIALLRLTGLIAWCATSWAVLKSLRAGPPAVIPISAAAIALLAHAQIDLDLVWVQSAPLGLILIALAAAPVRAAVPASPARQRFLAAIAAAALLAIALLSVPFAIARAWNWESALRSAADTVRPVADFNSRLTDLTKARAEGKATTDSIERILTDLSRTAGRTIPPNNDALRRALFELDFSLSAAAVPQLMQADAIDATDPHPRREASRLHIRRADAARLLGKPDDIRPALDEALRILTDRPAGYPPAPASIFANIAQVHLRRADALDSVDELKHAADAFELAVALDPYNLDLALQRFHLAQRQSDAPAVRTWAAKCLELDTLMRLDREARGLSEQDRYDLSKALDPAPSP